MSKQHFVVPRIYVILMWDWTQSLPAARRLKAFDAADAKVQAEMLISRSQCAAPDGRFAPTRLLRGIEPYEERRHGEPPWFE